MCWQRGPCSQGTGSLRPSSCWLGCPEAPKSTSSSPIGGSTLLFLPSVEEIKAQKPAGRTEPKAHVHACSEDPHGLQGRQPSHPQPRMGLPPGLSCSRTDTAGGGGWVLSHGSCGDSQKDWFPGHVSATHSHPPW